MTAISRLAVELDEPSHADPKRQTRDDDLTTARLPFIRVLTSNYYDTRELEAVVAPYL
jgi:hypothetical protein